MKAESCCVTVFFFSLSSPLQRRHLQKLINERCQSPVRKQKTNSAERKGRDRCEGTKLMRRPFYLPRADLRLEICARTNQWLGKSWSRTLSLLRTEISIYLFVLQISIYLLYARTKWLIIAVLFDNIRRRITSVRI